MCYSAMLESRFASYVRETGAEMDIEQFEEIYGWRHKWSQLRVARAVDRWFDEPNSPGELRIHDLISQYNAARVTKLETEIFAQRKRLASAERQLATKPTKKASEDKRIATKATARRGRSKLVYAPRRTHLGTVSSLDASPYPLRAQTNSGQRQAFQ